MNYTKKFGLLALLLVLISCGKEEEKSQTVPQEQPVAEQPVKVSEVQVRPVAYDKLTNWKKDNLKGAMKAFALSCQKIMASDSEYLSDSMIKIPTKAYKEICAKLNTVSLLEYHKFIEENFVPYEITYQNSNEGKFTSYYEISINASNTRNERFPVPIYGRPYDLFEINIKDFDDSLPNRKLSGRVVGQKVVPYYTREEIEKMYMKAPVILYASNFIDVYMMQVQGSALATLEDGSQVRVSYDSSNGQPFTAIGSVMLKNRLIRPNQASMMEIKEWLQGNEAKARELMNMNKRYIFHRLSYESGPIGAQGVPLTAGRSLAVDNAYIPYGSLLWLETSLPRYGNVEKMVVAQDTGSAIKGPIRGDYFWGTGGDDVLLMAGKMNTTGRYYIFVPKGVEVEL